METRVNLPERSWCGDGIQVVQPIGNFSRAPESGHDVFFVLDDHPLRTMGIEPADIRKFRIYAAQLRFYAFDARCAVGLFYRLPWRIGPSNTH